MPLSTSSDPLAALNHRHVANSASTNTELIDGIKDGSLAIDEPHLLTAETQTAGRGQRGRSWQSPRGNVYLSLYHPVKMPVNGLLSLVIGVELAKMPIIQILNNHLHAQGLTPIGVKWANDLGFYKRQQLSEQAFNNCNETDNINQQIIDFNKLAGILIEPVWQLGKLVGVVMGVGLNVKATPKLTTQTLEGMSYQALSLQDIYQLAKLENVAAMLDLQEIYQQISQALVAAIDCFEQLAHEKSVTKTYHMDSFLRQFNTMDALAGLRLRVTQNHNGHSDIITGDACGIDTNGCLQLRQDNGKLATLFTGRIDVINNV